MCENLSGVLSCFWVLWRTGFVSVLVWDSSISYLQLSINQPLSFCFLLLPLFCGSGFLQGGGLGDGGTLKRGIRKCEFHDSLLLLTAARSAYGAFVGPLAPLPSIVGQTLPSIGLWEKLWVHSSRLTKSKGPQESASLWNKRAVSFTWQLIENCSFEWLLFYLFLFFKWSGYCAWNIFVHWQLLDANCFLQRILLAEFQF